MCISDENSNRYPSKSVQLRMALLLTLMALPNFWAALPLPPGPFPHDSEKKLHDVATLRVSARVNPPSSLPPLRTEGVRAARKPVLTKVGARLFRCIRDCFGALPASRVSRRSQRGFVLSTKLHFMTGGRYKCSDPVKTNCPRWKRVWSGEIEHPLKPARNRFESLLLRFARDFCSPRMGGEACLFQVRHAGEMNRMWKRRTRRWRGGGSLVVCCKMEG